LIVKKCKFTSKYERIRHKTISKIWRRRKVHEYQISGGGNG